MKRWFVVEYRLFFAGLTIAAMSVQFAHNNGLAGFDPVNFFSFFTIESNIFIGLVFIFTSLLLICKKRENSTVSLLRGAAALYMTVTGIVYVLLLSGLEDSLSTPIPWVNAVLHYIMPLVALLDWLLIKPPRAIAFKKTIWWLTFPLAYFAYSLIRGHSTGWYPYPFLNAQEHGYAHVVAISLGLAVAMLSLVWFFAWSTKPEKQTSHVLNKS
ncbi:MAG: Pr6Pr family membrane protein [Candidatus Saccharimonadales bacterium]